MREATKAMMRKDRKLPGAMHGKHSMKNPNFMSPSWLLKAARSVSGDIDLDPASDDTAQKAVKAKRYFTKLDDGLSKNWVKPDVHTRIYLNAPGGLLRSKEQQASIPDEFRLTRSSAAVWWAKLCSEYALMDRIRSPVNGNQRLFSCEAFFIGFSIELLQNCQVFEREPFYYHPLDFPCCIPRDRISFVELDKRGKRTVAGEPGHGNVIVYMPPTSGSRIEKIKAFEQTFMKIGKVHVPTHWSIDQ